MIERLAVYGTLAPGRPNESVLADVDGVWTTGTVRGALRQDGWGAALGYPGIDLDDNGDAVEVALLTSAEIPNMLDDLDRFEGPGYQRQRVRVATADGDVDAWIYVLAE